MAGVGVMQVQIEIGFPGKWVLYGKGNSAFLLGGIANLLK